MHVNTEDILLSSFSGIDFNGYRFPLITIYIKPVDYPNKYVARVFDIETPTRLVMIKDTLEEIEEDIQNNTEFVFIPRGKDDLPCVHGIWL